MCVSNDFLARLECPVCVGLYTILDNFDNQLGGKGELYLPDRRILSVLGCTKNALKTHLKHLKSKGVIDFTRGVRRGTATQYRLLSKGSENEPKGVRGQNLTPKPLFRGQKQTPNFDPHYDHDMNDHDNFKDEKSKMIDVLRSMGVNGDSRRWVEALGVDRMRELVEIAVSRATTNPGGYLRVLVDQEILRGPVGYPANIQECFGNSPKVATLSVRDIKPGMTATHRRTGHQFKVKYAVAHRVILEELDKSGSFGINESDLKEYDFE